MKILSIKEVTTMRFLNLDAEQGRYKHTNEYVANYLRLSRVSYEQKKRSGRFSVPECKALCTLYKCSFEYLFETVDKMGAIT
jgi:hypothetical protein